MLCCILHEYKKDININKLYHFSVYSLKIVFLFTNTSTVPSYTDTSLLLISYLITQIKAASKMIEHVYFFIIFQRIISENV